MAIHPMPQSLVDAMAKLSERRQFAIAYQPDPDGGVVRKTQIPENCHPKDRRAIIAKMKTGVAGRFNRPMRIGKVPFPWLNQ